jgi:hypothetical protein
MVLGPWVQTGGVREAKNLKDLGPKAHNATILLIHIDLLQVLSTFWKLQNGYFSFGSALQRRGVQSNLLASPPQTLFALFASASEPILPEQHANLFRRPLREGVLCKKGQYVGFAGQEALLNLQNPGILPPSA